MEHKPPQNPTGNTSIYPNPTTKGMTTRLRRFILFKPLPFALPTSSPPSLPSTCATSTNHSSFNSSVHQSFFTTTTTTTNSSSSASPPDALEGLIDPDDSISSPVCLEDFSFLRHSPPVRDPPLPCLGEYSKDAVLIAKALNDSYTGDGAVFTLELERFLRKFRDKLESSLVVDVLNLIKNPHLGVQFFTWAGRQIGYVHTRAVYDALTEVTGCGGDVRVPEVLLRDIGEDDRRVLGILLNVIVQKCCRNGMWNAALEELGRLKDFGFKPSKLTYNALLQVFLKADRLDTARLVQREMASAGFRMDTSALGSFTYSLCKEGKWRDALELIEKEDFVPDTILYTSMISGLCEASLFDEAMDFLTRMRCGSSLPNVITYRTFLLGCLRKRQLGRCKRILIMMMEEGCYPDRKIFNSLVNAYCKAGEYSYAYKLLKKMRACGCPPGYLVYNMIIGGICGSEELPTLAALELAEKAYSEMLIERILLNKINLISYTRCLCAVGKFDQAYKVIHEMMANGFVPDASTYSKVIEFLCNSSRVEKAFLLFEEMKTSDIVPDVYTYSIIIDGFCKAGLVLQARKWFDEMIRDGCPANVVTYTSLIHAYLKMKNIENANELFERMLSDGCAPNIVTYTALVDGYCKAGNIEKAYQIYSRMQGQENAPELDRYFRLNLSDLESIDSISPNVFTYGALVNGLCKLDKVKEANDLLDVMVAAGCKPNQIVYDALIDGLCKAGKLDEAQRILTKMSENGCIPSEFTYGSLIDRLFKDKRLDLALKVLSRMLEDSCAPNVVIYTEMVDGLCKSGKIDEAYKLLLMMEEKGCHPNVVTYTAIIDGFGKANKVDKSLELFKVMGEKGCPPNYVTYRVLINHCCLVGLVDDAYDLLEEMKQTYWPMQVASYRKVIEGFSKDFLSTLGLLDVLSETDSNIPIISVYKILIDSFCKSGKLDKALDLSREVLSYSPLLHHASVVDMCSLLIKSLCFGSKADEAFKLFAELLRKGVTLEESVFFHLIMGLIRENRWDEALELSYTACHEGISQIQMQDT